MRKNVILVANWAVILVATSITVVGALVIVRFVIGDIGAPDYRDVTEGEDVSRYALPLTVEEVDLTESASEDGYYAVTLKSTDAYPRAFVLLKFDSRDELTKFRAKQVLAAELRLSPMQGEEDDGERTDK